MRRFGWVALALVPLMLAGAPGLAPPAHAKRVAGDDPTAIGPCLALLKVERSANQRLGINGLGMR